MFLIFTFWKYAFLAFLNFCFERSKQLKFLSYHLSCQQREKQINKKSMITTKPMPKTAALLNNSNNYH